MLSVRVFCIVLTVVLVILHDVKSHDDKKAEEIIKTCIKDNKLNTDELKILAADQMFTAPAVTNNIKCFVACYYKLYDILDDKGMHKPIPTVHYFESLYKEQKTKVPAAVTKCNNASKGLPYCDAAFNFEKCVREELK